MKLSFIVAGLFSAMAVKASLYEFTFKNVAMAKNCLKVNHDYISQVSTDYFRRGQSIYMLNDKTICHDTVEDNIYDVCGNVKITTCWD